MPNFCELVLPISAQEPVSNTAVMSWPFAPVFTPPSPALATPASLTHHGPLPPPTHVLGPLVPPSFRCLLRSLSPPQGGLPYLQWQPFPELFTPLCFIFLHSIYHHPAYATSYFIFCVCPHQWPHEAKDFISFPMLSTQQILKIFLK